MNVAHVNPFLTASLSVLGTVLRTEPKKESITAEANPSTTQQVNVAFGVTGNLQGVVIFGMRESTACQIASAMAGMKLTLYDSLVGSAIAELGNMVTGNAMTVLSESGVICDITPPTVVRGTNVNISTLDIPAISLHLDTGLGELVVRISLCGGSSRSSSGHESKAA